MNGPSPLTRLTARMLPDLLGLIDRVAFPVAEGPDGVSAACCPRCRAEVFFLEGPGGGLPLDRVADGKLGPGFDSLYIHQCRARWRGGFRFTA